MSTLSKSLPHLSFLTKKFKSEEEAAYIQLSPSWIICSVSVRDVNGFSMPVQLIVSLKISLPPLENYPKYEKSFTDSYHHNINNSKRKKK